MHMADALISPAVGGVMWGASATAIAYSARKVRTDLDESKVPLMGVAGAFVFAAQMLTFSIPGTGSSGHLAGALLLAILLGPQAAFLVMASILTVQALFFGDGGLLALGCNIFNMAFWTAFVAHPLVYRPVTGTAGSPSRGRVVAGSLLAAVLGAQLGALSVVLETTLSGISDLPFTTFLWLMLPIHLAIGVVEGLITAVVVLFVRQTQPELLEHGVTGATGKRLHLKPVLLGFGVAAVLAAGIFSWFASSSPDGLEWSVAKAGGGGETALTASAAHRAAADLQSLTAVLPDYSFKSASQASPRRAEPAAVRAGTSLAGVVGVCIVVVLAAGLGFVLRRRVRARPGDPAAR
jgi:cobalt/nickel transport system permease protein